MGKQLNEYAWGRVRNAVKRAKAMHFDGCHKIYLSMDEGQKQLSESYGYESHEPDFDKLKDWYDKSCGLRLITAVYTVNGDVNDENAIDGYDQLIPQGM